MADSSLGKRTRTDAGLLPRNAAPLLPLNIIPRTAEVSSTRFVGNAKELKSALNDKADNIVITDRKLALAVRVIKSVTYTKLALIAGGVLKGRYHLEEIGIYRLDLEGC